jgi:hypothetical protein
MKKAAARYGSLAALVLLTAFCLVNCDCDGTTGPEPYDGPWKVVDCPEGPSYLNGVFFLNANLGYAVGCDYVLRYDGSEWETDYKYPEKEGNKIGHFYDVWFNAPDDGWVVGAWYDEEENIQKGLIMHFDGGQWKEMVNIPGSVLWSSVFFIDEDHGWVGGYGVARWNGIEWQFEDTVSYIKGMYMNSPTDGWAINYYGPKIYHYDGVRWEKVIEQSMHHGYSINFRNEDRGWAAGGRTLLLEYVNGKWQEYARTENLAYCEAVHFAPDGAGWAVGQRTYKWNEAQNKWLYVEAPLRRGTLREVFVLDEGDAWAVGDARTIMHYQPKDRR